MYSLFVRYQFNFSHLISISFSRENLVYYVFDTFKIKYDLFETNMSGDYMGMLRICHVKRKKGEEFDLRLKKDSGRKGNVST